MSLSEISQGGGSVLSKRMALIWVLPNVLGIAAYLYFASWTWVPPVEPAGAAGDPFIWMLGAFPVLAAGAIFNVIWIIQILVSRRNRWRRAAIWLFVVIAWYSANRFDAYRSSPPTVQQSTQGIGKVQTRDA